MNGQTPTNTHSRSLPSGAFRPPSAAHALGSGAGGQGEDALLHTDRHNPRAPSSPGQGQHGKPTESEAARSVSTATAERTLDPPARSPPDISHTHSPPLALTPSPFRNPFPPEAAPRAPRPLARPAPSGSRGRGSTGLGRAFLGFGRPRALLC